MEELEELLECIIEEYSRVSNQWKKEDNYKEINFKQKVKNIYHNKDEILAIVLLYREFLEKATVPLVMKLQKFNIKNKSSVESRVKVQNSVEHKIENYMTAKHLNGNGPMERCLNDLFGMRIIYDKNIGYKEVEQLMKQSYPQLRCIEAIRGENQEYKAIHIYFKEDKYTFQWELQVWNRENELTNKKSHEKYKQDYKKWEIENKGGLSI